ncbi:hypothetical protein P6709_11835 [Jeotgalibacillus sp. ET6]|uniref:hypothetical protein n=1 Tax=Jeotgalibacillus sp. ET6 TaxID=3037260 RepID=UPI0024185EC9|nr:hypothetical protein [Jeotgalibacillus sp. ET6]MDG5472436.1 hypothetical protein [Jeotgalibacillus sp. ET6]
MKNHRFVEIVFENLESIILKADRFEKLSFDSLQKGENSREHYDVFYADDVHFQISTKDESELNYNSEEQPEPLGMYTANPVSNRVHDRPEILGRLLNFHDITSLDFLDDEENMLSSVRVPWSENDEMVNEYMKVRIEQGYVDVRIRKNSMISDE